MWFLLFCRFFPTIAMSEVKATMHVGRKTEQEEEFVF
jgi:hypothetical protein